MSFPLSRSQFLGHDSSPYFGLDRPTSRSLPSGRIAVAAVVGALAATAVLNRYLANKAEQDNPPTGKFLEIDGVRLHYVERGEGDALVLLHGNGSMIQDFGSSGLIEMAAKRYRVIAIDRPGFGHSDRPRTRIWTPQAQAELIHEAMRRIGISHAIVLGHSWGTQVAIALALKHPESVRGLVLASGYYYPSLRADVFPLSMPAVPVIGDVLRYTTAPLFARALWPLLMRKIFGPAAVPQKFRDGFPKALAVRPSQLRAAAVESAFMIPDALAFRDSYKSLKMPVAIIAGEEDRLIDIDEQSARLHRDIAHSTLQRVPGVGHMVHQSSPDAVLRAVDASVAEEVRKRPAA
jgi:pimeloyl-ACP methyl ester carboxylesterase